MTTARGVAVDLTKDDPWMIRALAEAETETWIWQQAAKRHAHLSHLDGQPHLAVLRQMLKPHGQLTPKQQGLLKAFLPGAFFRTSVCTCGEFFRSPLE